MAEKLHCKKCDAILLRKRIVCDTEGRTIEYNINYYRADRFVYGLILHQKSGA
ncbi:MAG: UTRA domain-containing protein [Luteolibacter sp.]